MPIADRYVAYSFSEERAATAAYRILSVLRDSTDVIVPGTCGLVTHTLEHTIGTCCYACTFVVSRVRTERSRYVWLDHEYPGARDEATRIWNVQSVRGLTSLLAS
ncbi:hypothetical protein EVAR_21973_1 [Eumeta japonica]|uniref:Uncharacterized protein n=1 Tax=Eumeta variegata TaxID=151549 RepID=A0A4C1VU98_EUMVA|nr:hypothetical protein EVAR_21973_1 [Eumeta japonica]